MSYYHHAYMADGTDNEKAFARACEKVGHTYAMPRDVTRTLKQVVSEASQLVTAAASVSSRTTSPVKLLSSASVAASTRPAEICYSKPGSRVGAMRDGGYRSWYRPDKRSNGAVCCQSCGVCGGWSVRPLALP